MDSDWISPRQRAGGPPQRNRVKELKKKFEAPQAQPRSQPQTTKREQVPELRKKFEHSNHAAEGSGTHSHDHDRCSEEGSEQPHHDEAEYVDILRTIVEHHQKDTASLQRNIQELEKLVDDLSCDKLNVSGGSSGRTRHGTYTKPSKRRSYTGSEIDRIVFERDYDDYYDSDDSEGWDAEYIPPGRNESELEDDVFNTGVSPKGFKHQRPLLAARHEMAKYGRRHSEPKEVLNHPGYTKKRQEKSEPTGKKEDKYVYPLRQDGKGTTKPTRKGTYTTEPTRKGTYKAETTRKGTYTTEPAGKGTYTAEPTRKGTYTTEPTRKGTYTAEPTRKGTYTTEPTRKGTYKAEPTRKSTYTAKPTRKGTYTTEPSRRGTYTATPKSGQESNTLQKTVTLRSPGRNDTLQYDINVQPCRVSGSASGEHVICDINIDLQENLPTYQFGHSTPPITPSRQREDSMSTPKSVFTKHNFAMRNLFDAERESPKYHSPKDTTIEWESPPDSPKNRTFEIKPQTSHTLNKTFTPDQNHEGEDEVDEAFQPPYHSSPQSYGNRTFEDSPHWKQKDSSDTAQNDRTFRESPQHAHGGGGGRLDRTFEDSPQWKQKDSSNSPQNDRTFRESPQHAHGGGGGRQDRTFEDSPQWANRTYEVSEDELEEESESHQHEDGSHYPQNDRTFRESPQHKHGGGGGRQDRTFEDSPQWANRTYEVSEDELEEESESHQLNKTFDT